MTTGECSLQPQLPCLPFANTVLVERGGEGLSGLGFRRLLKTLIKWSEPYRLSCSDIRRAQVSTERHDKCSLQTRPLVRMKVRQSLSSKTSSPSSECLLDCVPAGVAVHTYRTSPVRLAPAKCGKDVIKNEPVYS